MKPRTYVPLLALLAALLVPLHNAGAQVFEVTHPEVTEHGWEIEVLNGVVLDEVDPGDERSVHEFAVGFGFTRHWKSTIAVEVANPRGAPWEVEAFEWENLFALPLDGPFTLGVHTVLEVPQDPGIEEGAFAIGPVFETSLGPVTFIGNLLVEIPFEDGVDEGLAYAAQATMPVSEHVAIGIEAHGDIEEFFGDAVPGDEQSHFIGPALYFETELGDTVIEPRLAALFGLTEATPDAVLSFNIEIKFGADAKHH